MNQRLRMKSWFAILCALAVVVQNLHSAEADLVHGLDASGLSSVTGSQLNQLVDMATTATNKGMIIKKATRPDITTYPRYTNFLWLDISITPAVLKAYNYCCGDTDTNWVAAVAGSGTIGSDQLATAAVIAGKLGSNSVHTSNIVDSAVTTDKLNLAAVTSSKLASGSVSNLHVASRTIEGDKIAYNTIAETNIANAAIGTRHIGSQVINNDKLASQAVTTNKILGSTTGSQFLMTAPEGTNVIWRTMSFVTVFETNNIAIPSITTTNYHGQGSVPDIIRVALVNATTELGYAVGDEISAEYLINVVAENPVLSVAVDSTYWYLAPGAADWQVRPKGSTTFSQLDKAKWYIKARLIWFSQ
jgi:hypothetical protein